jgi:hypothetical protein
MLVGGIVLLVVAVAALFVARTQRARRQSYAGTERSACGDLDALARSVSAEAGAGSFRQTCEIGGRARPGPSGELKAPLSGQASVWYRATITHKSWQTVTTGTGQDRRTERREDSNVVSDETSQAPLIVDDGTGQVLVDPRGADVDHPEVSLDRFEPHAGGPQQGGTEIEAFGVTVRTGSDSGSLGFHRREQIIRPGRELYVLGEARDASGTLEVGKPGTGRFVISSRSEQELTASAGRWASIATAVAVVAGIAGAALVIVGLMG